MSSPVVKLAFWGIVLLVLLSMYLLPSIIAFRRQHPNRWSILALNVFLGYTGVVWAICLLWTTWDKLSTALWPVVRALTRKPYSGFAERIILALLNGCVAWLIWLGFQNEPHVLQPIIVVAAAVLAISAVLLPAHRHLDVMVPILLRAFRLLWGLISFAALFIASWYYLGDADFSQSFLFVASAVGPPYLVLWGASRIRRRSKARDAARRLARWDSSPAHGDPLLLYLRSFADEQFIGHVVWRQYRWSPEEIGDVFLNNGVPCPINSQYLSDKTVREFNRVVDWRKSKRVLPKRDWELETELDARLSAYGTFVAIGNDTYSQGAIRLRSTDERWRKDLERLASHAKLIICAPGSTEGVRWEVTTLIERGHDRKTIFANPGNSLLRNKKPELFVGPWRRDTVPPQISFWNGVLKNHPSFPAFAPLGEWFTIAPVDRQPWGIQPVLDLFAIAKRHGMLELTKSDEWALAHYLSLASSHGQI